nr:MAG TPA: hypothetical protein [Caudoviricetes sp.]
MITECVLSTYKLYSSWSHHRIKVEGYGSVNRIPFTDDMYIEGTLVSLKKELTTTYLFIANEPVIDTQSVTEDMYLLHEGVFDDTRAYGRCWFVGDEVKESNGIIYTSNGGKFHVRPLVGGLLV